MSSNDKLTPAEYKAYKEQLDRRVGKVVFLPETKMSLGGRRNRFLDPECRLYKILEKISDAIGKKHSVEISRYKTVKGKLCKFSVNLVENIHDQEMLISRATSLEHKLSFDLLDTQHWIYKANKTKSSLILHLGDIGGTSLDMTVATVKKTSEKDLPQPEEILDLKDAMLMIMGICKTDRELRFRKK